MKRECRLPAVVLAAFAAAVLAAASASHAVESQRFRLLSVTQSSKLLLVSQIPGKQKFVLDGGAAKITVDGKPAEFADLALYSVIHVRYEPRKGSKDGVALDGAATEIRVLTPDNQK